MNFYRIVVLMIMISLPNLVKAQCIPASERTALENLYDATYGPGWANASNWLSADESTWFGVTITDCHVTALDLPHNNLDGPIPSSIGDLTHLENLDFSNNVLEGSVPTALGQLASLLTVNLADNLLTQLPAFNSTQITELKVENNKLLFASIEANISKPGFTYVPQGSLPGGNYTFGSGQYTGINGVSFPGTYQWYVNGNAIPFQTYYYISFWPFTPQNAGTYHYEVTTPSLPGLTLRSEPFVLTAGSCVPNSERDALIALYNATGGNAWANQANWLTDAPLEKWYGVQVSGCHVTSLGLYGNQLRGEIPSEIGALTGLTSLDLSNNHLKGEIPVELANLNQLQSLYVGSNMLEGSVPTAIGALQYLYGAGFDGNLLDELPSFTGSYIWYLNISGNAMTFEDIAKNSVGEYYYEGQAATLPSQHLAVNPGSAVTLEASDAEPSNQYQWNKNGTPIPGETSSTYTLSSVSTADEAEYTVTITNTVFTSMTFTEPFVVTVSSGACVPLAERAALIDLYYATNGSAWFNRGGWLSANESTWFGVTVSGCHVTAVNLFNNNLSGSLPPSIANLTFLQNLTLGGNSLSGSVPAAVGTLPALQTFHVGSSAFVSIPHFTNPSISSLTVDGNRLDFDDLLPNALVPGFTYSGQQPHDLPFYSWGYELGMPIILRGISYEGPDYQYQWYKNFSPIGGANSSTYTIDAADFSDAAQYQLFVTHPSLPGVTMPAYNDFINVSGPSSCLPADEIAALIEIFNATGGPAWVTNDYWLTGGVHNWPGVTIVGCHVTELNLASNNLTGSLPEAIGDLPFLTSLNLSGNKLSGNLPPELGNLTSLQHLDLSFNSLTGALPAAFAGFTGLQSVRLEFNSLQGIPAFTAPALTSVNVSTNQLDFGDLEPNVAVTGLMYLPQEVAVAQSTLPATVGDPVTLLSSIAGSANHYQWYRNGAAIAGATSASLVIPSFQLSNEGRYTVKVTNDLVPGLTLSSESMVVAQDGCVTVDERAALMWLYHSTRGHKWTNHTNWLSTDESTWNGVTVSGCQVTQLALPSNNLAGQLPQQLGGLTSLWYLYLFNNTGLTGSIPLEITNMTGLQSLIITQTGISGSIPAEVSNLTGLATLDLSYNKLTGPIPANLGNLTNLQSLNLSNNSYYDNNAGLTGSIPASLGDLTNLSGIYLSNNHLSGSIPPELGNMTGFSASLDLSQNQLTGGIPAELNNLVFLNLSSNQLTGSLPPQLGTGNLLNLDVSNNQLSGPLPSEIGDWDELQSLSMNNNQFSGSIPPQIGDMQELRYLYIAANLLTGTIPPSIASAPNLAWVELSYNQLEGSIPPELGNVNTLQTLQLFSNQLSGTIPPELGDLPQLYNLNLGENQLSGPIPSSFGGSPLYNLSLYTNQLTGPIPPELGDMPNLQNFYAFNNQLSGSIPPELGNLPQISGIGLYNNQLTGPLPSELGNLSTLHFFQAQNNQLTGDVPAALGTLPVLWYFQIQNNNFTSIPAFGPSIVSLKVENNLLDFADLEPNVGRAGYTYSPQNTVLDGGSVSATIGCTLTVPFSTGGTHNNYQWSVEGSSIVGATSQQFAKSYATAADNGAYSVAVTNSVLPALTLNSAAWTVTVGGTQLGSPTVTDGSGCVGTQIALTAIGASGSEEYHWYSAPSGGASLASTSAFLTPALAVTTVYYASRYDPTPGCESLRIPVTASVVGGAPPAALGGGHCGPGQVLLTASGGAAGDYRWYTSPSGGSPIAGEVNDIFSTPILTTATNYYVSIDFAECESPRTTVIAQINNIPAAPTTTDNFSCTSPGTVSVSATGGSDGQYRWYVDDVTVTPISGQVNGDFTTPPLSATATYYVSINSGVCEGSRSAVQAIISSLPATPSATSASRCGPGVVALEATGGAAGNYRWHTLPVGGTAIAGATDGSFSTPSLSTTNTYYVSQVGGGCESNRVEVVATISDLPALPTITNGLSCGPGAVSLLADGGSDGSYRWYDQPTAGSAITDEVSSVFVTPSLTSSSSYYVSIVGATGCESGRVQAMADIMSIPSAPTSVNGFSCVPGPVVVSATGGSDGDYRWYAAETGGTSISGSTGATFMSPSLTTTTVYYVSKVSGTCESARSPVTAEIRFCPHAPAIADSESTVHLEGSIRVDIGPLISDADNDVDLSTLIILTPPVSGANAFITASGELEIDYSGVVFSGTDSLQIQVCDFAGLCTSRYLTIKVVGEIIIFNAISPNGDGKNDELYLQYIDFLPETKRNHVVILNRWGDMVWEGSNYDNSTVVFRGLNKNGDDLATGTYYYNIEFEDGTDPLTGFLSLKK